MATPDLEDERARFVELVDHEIVELANGAEFFVDQIAIFVQADTGGSQAVDAGVIDVAHEFDGVIDALGKLHYIEANGVEALGVAREGPALEQEISLFFQGVVDVGEQAAHQGVVIASFEKLHFGVFENLVGSVSVLGAVVDEGGRRTNHNEIGGIIREVGLQNFIEHLGR